MTVNINVLENKHYEFLSDHPDDIKINVFDSIDELLSSNGIVLLTCQLLVQYLNKVCLNSNNSYILHMPHEGTNTVNNILKQCFTDTTKIPFIISSGDFWSGIEYINIELFKIILGRTTRELLEKDWVTHKNIFLKEEKPFIFNFLNGVNRLHRHELIELLSKKNILNKGLWTALYDKKLLPQQYRFEFEENNISNGMYINAGWPAGIIHPSIYEDTYFSIVTETNFEIPCSYRTEKIYKPLKIGHPFIAVSNYGFYKDLHNMGFKTFGSLIDESFDKIENNSDRLLRISDVIADLCNSNLKEFLMATKDICQHNRNVMLETLDLPENKELLTKFIEKINCYAKTK